LIFFLVSMVVIILGNSLHFYYENGKMKIK